MPKGLIDPLLDRRKASTAFTSPHESHKPGGVPPQERYRVVTAFHHSQFLHCRNTKGIRITMTSTLRRNPLIHVGVALATLLSASALMASSHREAPAIVQSPGVDATDFYMFRSYEPGRDGFVTIVANYNPLQDAYGGPNYYPLDSNAAYDIHITNDGDASEDLTFRVFYDRVERAARLPVGNQNVAVPLVNIGRIGPGFGVANLSESRFSWLQVIRGPVDNPTSTTQVMNPRTGAGLFGVPMDNIGKKSFVNYAQYANNYIHDVNIAGCGASRFFVGQRADSFAVNLGETFDLVNYNPVGPIDGEQSDTADKNVTSIILEIPISCLTGGNSSGIIAGWTSAKLPRTRTLVDTPSYLNTGNHNGDYVQVSRLANPLVNEVAIGLPDKDLFNSSHPQDDAQFLSYVTNPTLPELLEILFGVRAPNAFPREDLVQVFLTGVPNANADGSVGEMMRLNTGVPVTPRASQNPLGFVAGDLAGYPNGRRPGDDTVDISLRAVMGVLLPADVAPDGQLPYTDGAEQNALQFTNAFPYLNTPYPGSPNDTP